MSKFLPAVSLETAVERARRSRWESGEREAARQMERMVSGLVSDLRRRRADRDFSFEVSGVVEFGERMVE